MDGVISCLASRSGTKSDSFAIDYQATLNCLEAAKNEGANHFVLLSAFCVKKPTLQVRPTITIYMVSMGEYVWVSLSHQLSMSSSHGLYTI